MSASIGGPATPQVVELWQPSGLGRAELTALVGGKAAGLSVMATELGLPVPPAFAITTEACRAYLAAGWPTGLDDEIRRAMHDLEARSGHRFGDPTDPLIVSVRSGAPVSMPGMMDTILDLGLDDAATAGLAASTGDPTFAAECRARLGAMYRDIVGREPPADPWSQLRGAIEAVFESWNGARARAYRQVEGIPDDLGTGVTVQAMVFGNLDARSATGVLFTRNPATGEPQLYGDVMFRAQGEDVVAGTHRTEPISVLDTRLPDVAGQVRESAATLERAFGDLCDVEFTIERGRLWLLQVRVGKRTPQAALRIAVDLAEAEGAPISRAEAVRRVGPLLADPPTIAAPDGDRPVPLARGLPASPGLASGEIATTAEAAVVAAEAGRTVVLVRTETSPDDVAGMARAAGVLTATGGLASHAAVVARGWGIPAVVGAAGVVVDDDSVRLGDRILRSGDVITIDGGTGEVFEGVVRVRRVIVPEAARLLGWARELGIQIPADGGPSGPAPALAPEGPDGIVAAVTAPPPAAPAPAPAALAVAPPAAADPTAGPGAAATREDVLRSLLVKGYAGPDGLAVALGTSPDEVSPTLERLLGEGLVELRAGSDRLTDAGRTRATELMSLDRERWGPDRAAAALDGFVALDRRMKEVVTAWQLRGEGASAIPNDHSDAAYDQRVLGDLRELHHDVSGWLAEQAAGLERLGRYAQRLGLALGGVEAGDVRFVASPRVDSYHTVWFELHEDLMDLAGRARADEVAAGRA